MMLLENQQHRLRRLVEQATEHVESLDQDTTGLQAFVVGGAVRDALLDTPSNDFDFVVVGETPDSMRDRGFHEIDASSFPVFHDDDREEWALARTETKTGYGYKGFDVHTEDVSLTEDLRRRDLRMNAIAVQINGPAYTPDIERSLMVFEHDTEPTVRLIDPFDGVRDAKRGVIRHVSEAFSEDPIRVLRAARYASRFEDHYTVGTNNTERTTPFRIADGTQDLMREVAPELNRMSRDRIGTEIEKAMMQATNPTRFWTVLRDVGALAVLAPKLDRSNIVPAGAEQYHAEGDTFTHTMLVLKRMHEQCEARDITGTDRVRRYMMAVAHDLGKVTIADEQGGLWSDDPPTRFSNHDDVGASDAVALGERLGLDQHYIEVMEDAAEYHMTVFDLPKWDAKQLIEFVKKRELIDYADKPWFATVPELIDLLQADHEGRYQQESDVDTDYIESEAAPDDTVRPMLDREAYMKPVRAARDVIDMVNGYDALAVGLCAEHDPGELDEEDFASTMSQCDECQTPGPWVEHEVDKRRVSLFNDRLEASQ